MPLARDWHISATGVLDGEATAEVTFTLRVNGVQFGGCGDKFGDMGGIRDADHRHRPVRLFGHALDR